MNLRKDHYRRCSLGRERVAREPWPPTTAGDARRALGGGGRGWPGPARASPAWTRGEAIKAGILWRSTNPAAAGCRRSDGPSRAPSLGRRATRPSPGPSNVFGSGLIKKFVFRSKATNKCIEISIKFFFKGKPLLF